VSFLYLYHGCHHSLNEIFQPKERDSPRFRMAEEFAAILAAIWPGLRGLIVEAPIQFWNPGPVD
jgi:hypothetical protein